MSCRPGKATFEREVGHVITKSLLAVWSETRPKIGVDLAREATLAGIGLIPIVGAPLSFSSALTLSADESRRRARSWISALWDLANASLG